MKKEKKKGKEKKEKKEAGLGRQKKVFYTNVDLVEVFSIKGGDDEKGGSSGGSKLVHGQRVTLEEDATLMEAIRDYAEMKQLGEEGLEMTSLTCRARRACLYVVIES
ncbi:hypothetical protein VPH35_097072 [Triticum aestivum]|uniref:Uncharacterized protein n=1 Tax=Aegilops tauschii TaxID=37682 RepID=M8APL2_AEGTA